MVQVGKVAARWGVKAIQVTGWNNGGQDQANPLHETDPRLGTFSEFKAAIQQVQALGVKVVLFTKFLWADQATEWYRNGTLRDLAIKDPYGDPYTGPAYKYSTVTQWSDINTKRFVPMDFLSAEYRDVIHGEFAKELALEPDGILQDECQHHVAQLCFDTTHGHRYGASVYAQDRAIIHNLAAMARSAGLPRSNQTFLFAGESPYDWEFDAYHFGYLRSADPAHVPLKRYTLPDRPIATAVIGFNDRNMINQCLLYRYIASYEPFNFHGSLDAMPHTIEYGMQMDALRTEQRQWLWDAEYLHQRPVTVLLDENGPQHQGPSVVGDMSNQGPLKYSVFRARGAEAACAVVLANYGGVTVGTLRVRVIVPSGPQCPVLKTAQWRLVDNTTWTSWVSGDTIDVPAQSAAILVPTSA